MLMAASAYPSRKMRRMERKENNTKRTHACTGQEKNWQEFKFKLLLLLLLLLLLVVLVVLVVAAATVAVALAVVAVVVLPYSSPLPPTQFTTLSPLGKGRG